MFDQLCSKFYEMQGCNFQILNSIPLSFSPSYIYKHTIVKLGKMLKGFPLDFLAACTDPFHHFELNLHLKTWIIQGQIKCH